MTGQECFCDQMRAEGYREVCPHCIVTKGWSREPTPAERGAQLMTAQPKEAREAAAPFVNALSDWYLGDRKMSDVLVEAFARFERDTIARVSGAVEAYPAEIGRLHLGEERSDGETLCSHGHEVPEGHPLYWHQAVSQYDDSDPYCLEHAIDLHASDQGWCETCVARGMAEEYPSDTLAKLQERCERLEGALADRETALKATAEALAATTAKLIALQGSSQ